MLFANFFFFFFLSWFFFFFFLLVFSGVLQKGQCGTGEERQNDFGAACRRRQTARARGEAPAAWYERFFFFFFFFFFCRVVRLVGSDDVVTGGVCSAGAGQSGKSTVAKQMKIIHMSGFSTEERASYTSVICSNIVVSMRAILAACEEFKVKTSKSNKVRLSNCFFSLFFWGFFFFSFCIFFRPFC
jgi:hypothetical protein